MLKYLNAKFLKLTLGFTFGVSALAAQSYDWAPVQEEGTCCEKQACSPYGLKVAYTTPRSIATKHGYATLGAFYCPSDFECFAPYADIRVHHLDNGRWAGNFGVGIQKRVFSCYGMSKVRGYVFYDTQKTSYRTYSQVTLGAEWLGERLDVRLNGYLPTKHEGHPRDVRVFNYRGGYYAKRERLQYTWRGVELDFSKRICFWRNLELYLTAGPYFFESRRDSATGVKFRAETTLWRGLGLAVQTTYDHHFKSRTFGQISWTLPLGGDCGCANLCCEPVRRQELIVLSKHCHWKTNYKKRD